MNKDLRYANVDKKNIEPEKFLCIRIRYILMPFEELYVIFPFLNENEKLILFLIQNTNIFN